MFKARLAALPLSFCAIVLSVGVAACEGAVQLGEKIGALELTTLDGPSFVMDNYGMDGRIGTVIAFLSVRRLVTDRMAERINYVQEEYRHDDILWVRVGANTAESGDELREFCQKRGMIFPVYQDPQGRIGKRLAPEVLVSSPTQPVGNSIIFTDGIGRVLVFNNTSQGRSPLNVIRSLDGGQTWEEPLALESNPGEYSYPCVIQTSDGRIHISYTFRRYTIKHVEINEDWLVGLKRPN